MIITIKDNNDDNNDNNYNNNNNDNNYSVTKEKDEEHDK